MTHHSEEGKPDDSLVWLRREINEAHAQEEEGWLRERLEKLGHSLEHFMDELREKSDELRDELVEELLQLETDLQEKHPRIAEGISAAVRILSSSGV